MRATQLFIRWLFSQLEAVADLVLCYGFTAELKKQKQNDAVVHQYRRIYSSYCKTLKINKNSIVRLWYS